MKLTKFRNEFSGDFNKFVTNAGSGRAEKQYHVVDGKPCIKVDDNGEIVTFDRWSDIQKNKDANNYKKLLESGCDIKLFEANADSYVDTTQFGDNGAELLAAKSKLNEKNINVDDLKTMIAEIFANQIKLKQEKQKKVEEQKQNKEVNNVDKK